jgi:ligand-binding sensor domain-containing protein
MFMPPGFHYPGDGRLIDPDGRYFSITDMLDDGDGNLWLGTWGYGAANAATTSYMIELMPFGLIQKNVKTIYEYDGRLWMAGAAIDASRTGS